jgi:CRP-like cAMP-binding protein
MADLLDTIRRQIDERLAELRPSVEEAASLEAALAAVESANGAAAPARRRRRGSRSPSTGRPGRRRGETRERLIDYVRANPGSTAGDVAKALGLNRNSLATRLAQLAKSGELTKATRGYTAP